MYCPTAFYEVHINLKTLERRVYPKANLPEDGKGAFACRDGGYYIQQPVGKLADFIRSGKLPNPVVEHGLITWGKVSSLQLGPSGTIHRAIFDQDFPKELLRDGSPEYEYEVEEHGSRWDEPGFLHRNPHWNPDQLAAAELSGNPEDMEAAIRDILPVYKDGLLTVGFDLSGMGDKAKLGDSDTFQVGASADDASMQEGYGTMDPLDRGYIRQNSDTTQTQRYWGAYRWTGTFPTQGDTIVSCIWKPYVYATTTDDPNINIHFEYGAAPAQFTTDAHDIDNRTRTSTSVPWVTTGVGAGSQDSPEAKTALQEVVDDYSPSAIVLINRPNQDADYLFYARSWDYSGNSDGAELYIEWTAGGGPAGRTMGSLAGQGGLAGHGGIAGKRGGIAA
jgi:hypothetical protein